LSNFSTIAALSVGKAAITRARARGSRKRNRAFSGAATKSLPAPPGAPLKIFLRRTRPLPRLVAISACAFPAHRRRFLHPLSPLLVFPIDPSKLHARRAASKIEYKNLVARAAISDREPDLDP